MGNCPKLNGTVKRRSLLQKLVGQDGGCLSALCAALVSISLYE